MKSGGWTYEGIFNKIEIVMTRAPILRNNTGGGMLRP